MQKPRCQPITPHGLSRSTAWYTNKRICTLSSLGKDVPDAERREFGGLLLHVCPRQGAPNLRLSLEARDELCRGDGLAYVALRVVSYVDQEAGDSCGEGFLANGAWLFQVGGG